MPEPTGRDPDVHERLRRDARLEAAEGLESLLAEDNDGPPYEPQQLSLGTGDPRCLYDRWMRTSTRLTWKQWAAIGHCIRRGERLSICNICPAQGDC